MNCEYVDRLLPLYVGSDLEPERSSLVAAHLQSCTECARAADEYAAADRLLHEYEPPLFCDEVYSGIRRQVLDEIKRKSDASVWSSVVLQVFTPLAQPRMRWITVALLLAMSATAFYFSGNVNRTNQRAHNHVVTDGPPTEEQSTADSRAGSQSEDNNSEASSSPSSKGSDTLVSTARAFTGKKVRSGGKRSRQREKTLVEVVSTSRTDGRKPLVLPNKRLVHSDIDFSQPSSAPAPLRVEMQTSDPNIRIIWLSSQRPGTTGVKETSKGI